MVKREITLRLAALLLLASVAVGMCACTPRAKDDGKIKIVCTLFPQYDWLRNIVGKNENIELSLLVKNGTDIHSYQPTAADIMGISDCDMIVYLGGGADTWVEEALDRAGCENIKKIPLLECEGVVLRDISSESEDYSHEEHSHEHSHEGHDHGANDEHLWLSLKNAATLCAVIRDAVCELDGDNASLYRENSERYISRIVELDAEYSEAIETVDEHDRFVLFCDRFPFVYLLEDYGVGYSAAFEGCSSDANADFATVLRLIDELETHSLNCVVVTENADWALANTVVSSAKDFNGEILVMNSLQSVSERQIKNGVDYLSVMEYNLGVLKRALKIKD